MNRAEYNRLLDLQVRVQRISADLPEEAMVDAVDRSNLNQVLQEIEDMMDEAVRAGLTDG